MNDRQESVCQWAHELIERRDFVIVDTETTGLDDSAECVQIVVVNAWGKVGFSSLVRPECPVDEGGRAFEIHGYSNAMLRSAPKFQYVYPLLRGWLKGARVIAYNADFDRRVISQACDRCDFVPMWSPGMWECAMLLYAQYEGSPGKYGGFKWHKLQEACAALGMRLDRNWHDAAADAIATFELIEALAGKWEGAE